MRLSACILLASGTLCSTALAEKPCLNEVNAYLASTEDDTISSRDTLFDCLALSYAEYNTPRGDAGVYINLTPGAESPTWFPLPEIFEDFLARQGLSIEPGLEVLIAPENQFPVEQIATQPADILESSTTDLPSFDTEEPMIEGGSFPNGDYGGGGGGDFGGGGAF